MSFPVTRVFLAFSGAISGAIGAMVLFAPHAFFATNHITLGTDPNLLSEIRAPGGVLVTAGLIMICGALRTQLRQVALITGAGVFGTYGLSRLISLLLDGIPSSSLLSALGIELVVAMIALYLIDRGKAKDLL